MSLYESLIKNVGIGKDALNKPFLKELRNEMCDDYKGFMLRFFSKTSFTKVHSMIADALNWFNDREAFVTGARYRDREQTILKMYLKKPNLESTYIAFFAVDDDNFYVIDGVDGFKKAYKKLDNAFNKYTVISPLKELSDLTRRVAAKHITDVPMRKYNVKDAKGALEELLN